MTVTASPKSKRSSRPMEAMVGSRGLHAARWRTRAAIAAGMSFFSVAFNPVPGQAADDCDVYDARVITTPAPPQWGPTYKSFESAMSRFPTEADVVVFGDSLAEGWPEKSLQSVFPGKSIANIGIGGAFIQNALWNLEQLPIDRVSPSAVVMILGTNNLKSRSKPCAMQAGLAETVEKLHQAWPQSMIYIFTIPPRGKIFDEFESDRQEVNRFIQEMPSEYSYVRVVTGFDDKITCGMRESSQLQGWFPDYFPDVCPNYSKDNLHFSRLGYDVLAEILKNERK